MTKEIFERDALDEYQRALECWNNKIRTLEDARVRVVNWRKTSIKLKQHASTDVVRDSLVEALEYLASAEKAVEKMKPAPAKSAKKLAEQTKPRAKITRWRDHWQPPMFW